MEAKQSDIVARENQERANSGLKGTWRPEGEEANLKVQQDRGYEEIAGSSIVFADQPARQTERVATPLRKPTSGIGPKR